MSEMPVREHMHSENGSSGADASHDRHGRFVKGNSGGRGNPFGRQVAALRAVLLACITQDDVQEVVAALLAQAKKGNVAAARLILTYSVGKPASTVDPDQGDFDECQPIPEPVAPPADVGATGQHPAQSALPTTGDGMADLLAARRGATSDSPGATAGAEGERQCGNRKHRKQLQKQARLARHMQQAAARTSAPVPEAPQRPPAAAQGIAAASRQPTAFNGEKHPRPTVSNGA
jgi:hypothetical protein